jgi:predicted ArsR family transcriptional regulator
MAPSSPHDDLILSDPRVLRAVAQPVRNALLTHLQRHGPATVASLAGDLEIGASTAGRHLRVLAEHGLVRPTSEQSGGRSRTWEAVANGLAIEMPA